ncbi:MAG TPA: 5-oxoprolinase/urea amidolyase family protein [Mycobacteriales bacterium]|nr:5-oxoprolinase/urea amidolyase family protein [Mycobacteriales bacterium]
MTAALTVVKAGLQTTVQDLPGRTGLWGVGVPPSGAWDDLSFALANAAVGNDLGAPGLEGVLQGPELRALRDVVVCVTGGSGAAAIDGEPLPRGEARTLLAGSVLSVGATSDGLRCYVAVRGGIDVPAVLGSTSTFRLGKFGGHEGRPLQPGDTLAVGRGPAGATRSVAALLPVMRREWKVRVLTGPHGAPEHLTTDGVEELFAATWTIDHRSDRTGVRLIGPSPQWARDDGGEAGLHPSNIHDSAYPVGGVMLAGNTPVIVGPDGPSLGGFVVPAVVVRCDRWKLAQARPGDSVRLVPVTAEHAAALNATRAARLAGALDGSAITPPAEPAHEPGGTTPAATSTPRPLAVVPASGSLPELTVRRAGDHHVLAELGPPVLDLRVRVVTHLLAQVLGKDHDGVIEMVEGVRSLLCAVDERRLPLADLGQRLAAAYRTLPDPETVSLPSREVVLPLSLDDPAALEAVGRYAVSVRADAPWCPDNVEFIRRVNGLARREDVFDIVQSATYLVVGLGDVYLGAPVAVPLDPRHRLVTTKYDPARTWTPENAVGIGGVYLCIYGMEGPGGYQLVGRTVPVWRLTGDDESPWLLRVFDRLRFEPVSAAELMSWRADIATGRRGLDAKPTTFSLAEVDDIARLHSEEIEQFLATRDASFAAERRRWGSTASAARS